MAKTGTGQPVDEKLAEEDLDSPVVSDRRARRKRKRGTVVEKVSTAEMVGTDKKDRPTPSSRRKATKSAASGPFEQTIQRIPGVRSLYNYFRAAINEMKKVTWPSREDTIRMTQMVLGVTIAFSLGLGLLDVFYSWWFRQALDEDVLFLGVAAGVLAIGGVFMWFIFRSTEEYSPF